MDGTTPSRSADDRTRQTETAADREIRKNELIVAYRPIVRGAALGVVIYFVINCAKRALVSSGTEQAVLVAISVTAAFLSIGIYVALKRVTRTETLEVGGSLLGIAMLISSNVHLLFSFEQENLTYYVLLMPVFAALLPTLRSIVTGVLLSCASLIYFVAVNVPELLTDYLSVMVAGLVASTGIAFLIRGAVVAAVRARIEALQEREAAERLGRQTRHLAERDALTGLANRHTFFAAFEERLASLRIDRQPFLLGLVDLDSFKPINDTYGHAAGDTVLSEVARRLEALPVDSVLAARLGGDEFALLVPIRGAPEDAAAALGKAGAAALREPYDLGDCMAPASGSIGILICDRPQLEPRELMERADHALYVAKRKRRGEAVIFNETLETDMLTSGKIDRALRHCDLERELCVHFQPQYDLVKERISSFEALARWSSPTLGTIAPNVFIPAAERSGQIRQITRMLLGKALAVLADWPEHLGLSFNLSTHDLMSPEAVTGILEAVEASGIAPGRIEFEITETAMMGDFDQACASIQRISEVGCSLALDDFGIGYSNFNYLHKLPVKRIKIDRSFLVRLMDDTSAIKIVRTLIGLSRTLDLECVIEGVETQAQLNLLRSFGARYIQGYLIGAPVPAESIRVTLARVDALNPLEPVRTTRRRAG